MTTIQADFRQSAGTVKPMHATNNGPSARLSAIERGKLHPYNSNFEDFKEAGIPFARTHDASFYPAYGLEHTVDVNNVFPNFDADPTLPENYDFTCTDHYMQVCELAGVEVFYRLGHRIEHEVKKYGTLPPKDFQKWAVICEHIIRHYTEGWANGFQMKMTYWEIWNEPDLDADDALNKRTWGGTKAQFFEFYHVAATHLKKCFPHLKIGGPVLAHDLAWAEDFLAQLKAPLDFFSWHIYAHEIEPITAKAQKVRALLDKYGYQNTESILNEWNYVLGWEGDEIVYSHKMKKQIKGAAFTLATMCACQYAPVDMLMYYDARPATNWNGMFAPDAVGERMKGYYPFPMFNALYTLGESVDVQTEGDGFYAAAAKKEGEYAIAFTHFNDDDMTEAKEVSVSLAGLSGENGTLLEIYLLDVDHNLEKVEAITFFGDRFTWQKTLPNFTSYLFKLKSL